MTYTLLARADDGGLGNQTAELARHVPPSKVLVVNPARTRGGMHLDRFPDGEVRVHDGDVLDRDTILWACTGVDTAVTVECWYSRRFIEVARKRGVRTVCQANPELLVDAAASETVVLPTHWEAERVNARRRELGLPDARYLPVPVARDRLPERPSTGQLTTVYHPSAPAMLDRNGTDILLASLRYCRAPLRVLIRGEQRPTGHVGRCTVEWLPHARDYWESYPPADLMVLPRRYGGLSLSMQEAASLGMPIVTLDLEPQRRWLDPASLVACTPARRVGMRGGQFTVWDADPRALARRLDNLAEFPDTLTRLRERSLDWAESLDWASWVPAYERLLS